MPRRAISTLVAEMRDEKPLEVSTGVSVSVSERFSSVVGVVSGGDVSAECRIRNLGCRVGNRGEKGRESPSSGDPIGSGRGMKTLAVDDSAIVTVCDRFSTSATFRRCLCYVCFVAALFYEGRAERDNG